MNEKQIIEIRDKFLFFDNHKKIMNIMGYEYDESISHNKNCVNFFVIMRDSNRLNELSKIIDKELGITPVETETPKTKWEYKVIISESLKFVSNDRYITGILNEYGADGWEVCGVELDRYLLKRKIE